MIDTNEFCRKEYGEKLYKISFDAGFFCPNRDGKAGSRGCIFCSLEGSGDFAVKLYDIDENGNKIFVNKAEFEQRMTIAKAKVAKKYKGSRYIAYFQAFTNTYADVETLRRIYEPVIMRDDIAVLSIATRPDCLNDEIYALLDELNKIKPVWVELGLQSIKPETINYIRRGYENKLYETAVLRLNEIGIHTITHVILYLPGETLEDMLNTVRFCVKAGTKGIKLQLLHILKGTDLEVDYNKNPEKFNIPSLEEYCKTVKQCTEVCPEDMVFHRLSGDAPKRLLVEPKWSSDKKHVMNALNDTLKPSGPWYVYILKCGDGSFYTGSTNDVIKRFKSHDSAKGCKYTASHQPVELVYKEELPSKREALKREYAIKQLTRKQKESLVNTAHF